MGRDYDKTWKEPPKGLISVKTSFDMDDSFSSIWSQFKRNKILRADNGRISKRWFRKSMIDEAPSGDVDKLDVLKSEVKPRAPINPPLTVSNPYLIG